MFTGFRVLDGSQENFVRSLKKFPIFDKIHYIVMIVSKEF